VKRQLKIPGYLRYMDDFTLFGDEAAGLERARDAIEAWLRRERGLELGRKRWDVVPTRQPACFVGYHVTCAGLWPGPKVKKRLRVRVRAAAARGGQALTRTLRSYRGIFLF
jgi:hypothetical protein